MRGYPLSTSRQFGGFFGLEARQGRAMHTAAHRFNTACGAIRQLLDAIGQNGGFATVWVPTFLCPQVEIAIARAACGFKIRRYGLREDLEPLLCDAEPQDLIYFYNVFGLKGSSVPGLPDNAIVDNAHAFFQPPARNRATLYSARKFFGVPDGAYLYCNDPIEVPERPSPSVRGWHLLKRIEEGPEAAYHDFLAAEDELAAMPPQAMSALAQHILKSIDYDDVRRARLENFGIVHAALGHKNELARLIDLALADPQFVPFSYPYLTAHAADLRQSLIARKIYVPHLWRGLSDRAEMTVFEHHLCDDTVHLPIDQRYSVEDMTHMLAQGRLLD